MLDIENVINSITSILNEYFAKPLQFEDDRRKVATYVKRQILSNLPVAKK